MVPTTKNANPTLNSNGSHLVDPREGKEAGKNQLLFFALSAALVSGARMSDGIFAPNSPTLTPCALKTFVAF